MTAGSAPMFRWKPAILGLLLGLAALLHAISAPTSSNSLASALLSDPHALCLSLAGEPGDGQAPSGHRDCDECCLPGVVGAPLPTAAFVEAFPIAVWADVIFAKPVSALFAAPAFEAWAPGRAQRGPPSTSIA